MEKVTLPRDVAVAIEFQKSHGNDWKLYDIELIKEERHSLSNTSLATIYHYYSENRREYFSALVNGYAIEQTPEEKVREYYEELYAEVNNGSFAPVRERAAELHALEKTLDLLGINIPGVNAPIEGINA